MNMKHLIWFSIVFVSGCLVSGYIGYEKANQRVVTVRIASGLITLDALKKLRAGDVKGATGEIEVRCFADSVGVLSESGWRSDWYRNTEVPALITYRNAYRTNRADWSPMEQRLEILLAQKP